MVEADPPFVGLNNYIKILWTPEFWEEVKLTIIWTGSNLGLIIPIGVLIALLLNQEYKGKSFFRTWTLLPWMFPIVVTTLMWRWMLYPVSGVINHILKQIGMITAPIEFLSDSSIAMFTVVLVNTWRWTPFVAIVILGTLQTIPKDIYEAATVDGAGIFQKFFYITLPHILPSVIINSFILMLWLFNMFPPIWLLTQGGPSRATMTLAISIYKKGFQIFRMSEAATLSIILLIILSITTWLYFKFVGGKWGRLND